MISSNLIKHWYPDEQKNGSLVFYSWLRQHIHSRQRVLNLGAGPASGNGLKVLKGEVETIVGVDIDKAVLGNHELDEAYIVDGKNLPFDDQSFDLVFGDYVLEHVEFPDMCLKEVARVLRPGGSFFFRTPNKYHYVSLVSHWTPHWFHELIANRSRGLSADAQKPYRAFYRLNTERRIRAVAKCAGFSKAELRFVECEPSYLVFATLPFLLGVLYERTVNRFDCLGGLRANIFARLVR